MSFFGGGSSPPPIIQAPPPLPKESDAEVKAAKARERERIRKMRGRRSTILTGGQGVQEEAKTGKKSLLGE